jgi:hypothetical protein
MKNRFIFYMIALLVMVGCTGENLPEGVLPKKKMVAVLVDIHLAESINNQRFSMSLLQDSLPENLYLSICKKYNVERADVEKSLLYYGKHTREYLPIYEEVLNILSEIEVKAKSDTIRPVNAGGLNLDTSKVKKDGQPAGNQLPTVQ